MPRKRKYDPKTFSSNRAILVEQRHRAFQTAYESNGNNATQAAITAGYSPRTANQQGAQLLIRLGLRRAAGEGERAAFENSRLTNERILQELERIVVSDIRKLYDDKGRRLEIHELDDDTAAAVSSVDYSEGELSKVRLHDKLVAIKQAMQHRGMFERDNAQRSPNLAIQVNLVATPKKIED